ncbi:hypothetical protein CATMIT_01811, partial [Catenibacterium mitsuokai DSM 15897]
GDDAAGAHALRAGGVGAADGDLGAELGDAAAGEVVLVVPGVAVGVGVALELAEVVVAVAADLVERIGDAERAAAGVVGGDGLADLGDAGDGGADRGERHGRAGGDERAVLAGLHHAAGAVVALLGDRAEVVDGEAQAAGDVVDVVRLAIALGREHAGHAERGVDVGDGGAGAEGDGAVVAHGH